MFEIITESYQGYIDWNDMIYKETYCKKDVQSQVANPFHECLDIRSLM